jgi:hypothetical protein
MFPVRFLIRLCAMFDSARSALWLATPRVPRSATLPLTTFVCLKSERECESVAAASGAS